MARRLKTESLVSTLKAPYAKVEVDHIQTNSLENPSSIIEGYLGAYTTNDLIILKGCVVTITGTTAAITKGAMYYNGEIFQVAAASGIVGAAGGTAWVWQISDVSIQSKFSDGNMYDWMETRTIVLLGALFGSGIADYANTKPFNPSRSDRQTDFATGLSLSVPGSGGSLLQIGNPLTTASGINKDYMLTFTWSFSRTTVNVEGYIGFYKNGTLVQEFHHTPMGTNGQSTVNTITYLDKNIVAGTIYTVKIHSGANQYLVEGYTFCIDGQI